MSEENVEVIRRGYEAFNRGDLDATVADFAPTFEYVATGAIPGFEGVFRGPEGWKGLLSGFFDEFHDPHVEIRDLREAGEDHVLALATYGGRGKQSGAEASWDMWQLWTVREGKVVGGQGFTGREEALEAAGLSE